MNAAPGAVGRAEQDYLTELFADDIDGARAGGEQLALGELPDPPHDAPGSTTTWCCWATPFTRRTSPSAPAPRWRWRTPSSWPVSWAASRDLPTALGAYQDARTPAVARIQDAAVPSLAWWERFGQYQRDLDPFTFAFHFFSRSIAVDKMAQRVPELVTRPVTVGPPCTAAMP